MKKIIFLISLSSIFLFFNSFNEKKTSEIKCNIVTYKILKPEHKSMSNTQINPDAKNLIEGIKLAYNDIECKLYYTNEKSIFKQVDKLEKNDDNAYKMASFQVGGLYYKDLVNKDKVKHLEIYGETINVILPFNQYKWEITKETKIISGYKCYKATCVYEENDKIRGRINRFTPEVWFTPAIPASFGPRGLDGLPGLVLEGKFNDWASFCAKKIEFDVTTKISFEKPSKDKYYTEAEFQDFMAKAMKKIIDN